jgi:hypothetical protein
VSEGEGEYFDCTHGCAGDGRNEGGTRGD